MEMKLKPWVEQADGGIRFKGRPVGEDGGNRVWGTPQGGIYIGLPKNLATDTDGKVFVPDWLAAKHKQFWDVVN